MFGGLLTKLFNMNAQKLAIANALSAEIQNHQDVMDEMKKTLEKEFPPHVDQPKDYEPVRDILIKVGNASFTVSRLYVSDEQMAEIADGCLDWIIRTIKMNKEALEEQFEKL
jgi:hypothetical protein